MDRLTQAVVAAKDGNPFAPVSVVVGSPAAGVLIRRAVARQHAVANVHTYTIGALAAAIARDALDASGRAPLASGIRRRAVRAAIADAAADGITIGDASDHPSTVRAFDARFREIRRCSADALRSLRSIDDAAAVMAIYDRFRERVGSRWYDEIDVADEAARQVAGGRELPAVGRVVVDTIPPLACAEQRVLDALHARGLLTDASPGPVDVASIRAANVVVAPEPETEVRLAIREILRLAGQGLALADVAVVHPGGPYGRLLPELLDAADVPWGGRSDTTLADTVTGRAILALLRLRDTELARGDVMALLASAPIVDRSTGELVPASTWERISRDARVLGGAGQWDHRLRRLQSELGATTGQGIGRRIAEVESLRTFVASLADALEPPAVRTWSAFATWALDLFGFLGQTDRDERERVEAAIAGLGMLDAAEGNGRVTTAVFIDEVDAQLSAPAGRRPLGHGVTIGRPADLYGIPAAAVIVLGMNEGTFPRRRRDDPLVPDAVRSVTRGELPTRREQRVADHVELATILRRAPERVLFAARADQRAQQRRNPSRWLLAWSPPVGGEIPRRSSDIVPVASFSTAVLADTPTCEQEAALHVLALGNPADALRLARNVTALRARHSISLSEWDGVVGPHPGVALDKRVVSPTAVEAWATCPFRHFLRTVLRVEPTDTPEDRVGTDPLERGTLVHEVLERFVRWRLSHTSASGGATPSPEEQSAVIDQLTVDVCAEFESAGRVGRAVPWELERRTLRADLAAVLALDAADEAASGFRPVLAEASFGLGPDDAFGVAEVGLPDGRVVRFRGQVDRVDVTADGTRVRVVDYKTGRSGNYKTDLEGKKGQPPADPTAAGRRLQLPVYASAVASAHPDAEISAEYWFVTDAAKGYPRVRVDLDERTRQRFLDVLTQIADAIDSGLFPANPGADQLDTWQNCRYCEYDRVCPARRSEAFDRRQDEPAIVHFLGLKDVD